MSHDKLNPPLPFDMTREIDRATKDVTLQQYVNTATTTRDGNRIDVLDQTFGDRATPLRELAGRIRQHALDNLDHYLEQFVDNAEAAGATVHFAPDAEAANAICLSIAAKHGAKLCVKSKSMVTEEIGLVHAYERAGIETLETDLGEFVLQLDGDVPSHIVTPMIHRDRTDVAQLFERTLDAPYTEDPLALTKIAREWMRERYRRADLGMSGANFLVAETGSIVICTNEGNADLSTGGPNVHIAVTGIEKVLPRLEHLSVMLKLLARSATAQPITVYTTCITGPRRADDHDGPEHVHIVLLDNGRSDVLRDASRELLRCIRCGSCLNACPVYRKVGGGHAYGAVYSGPIGAILTPHLKGIENYPDLPAASSLCGACHRACPVNIDIPKHLVRLRGELNDRRINDWKERLGYRMWAASLTSARRYRMASRFSKMVLRALGRGPAIDDPTGDRRWVSKGPGPLAGWTDKRDLPTPTSQSFRQWWRSQRGS